MKKTTMDYWVDLAIGGALVFSAISGLVFLLPGDATTGVLGISYQVWNSLHTWSSLALIAGVGAHLALHWKWMVSMTRRMLSPTGRREAPKAAPEPAPAEAKGTLASRRTFLALGGAAAVAAGLLVAGRAVLDAAPAEVRSTTSETSSTTQRGRVACPRGLVNDPYPGKCKHYVDTTGDGFCDYSVPG
jgi:hypothetical protein